MEAHFIFIKTKGDIWPRRRISTIIEFGQIKAANMR